MCAWFHSGWIIIVPLVMMALCILMCVLMRRLVFGGSAGCCGPRHGEFYPESQKRPQGDSESSKG